MDNTNASPGVVNTSYDYGAIPKALRDYSHWILWKYESKPGVDKPAKVPYLANGRRADPTNREHFLSFDEAVSYYELDQVVEEHGFAGIGVVLIPGCGMVGIDLDSVADWKDLAKGIIGRFRGKGYMEKSPSGNGVRILVEGYLPDGSRNRSKYFYQGKVEVYDADRFLTITGVKAEGDLCGDQSELVAEFVKPLNDGANQVQTSITDPKLYAPEKIADDEVLFEMAGMASKGLPGAQAFMRIYNDGFEDEDPSDALASAVASLVNVTKNIDQIKRVLLGSEHIAGYEDRRTGIPKFERWFSSEVPKILRRKIDEVEEERRQQHELLAEPGYLDQYIYITKGKEFFDVFNREIHSIDELNVKYKHLHTGQRGDPLIGSILTSDAHFMETRQVYGKMWMPVRFGDDSPPMIAHMGKRYVNTWDGFMTDPRPGSVQPWLDLLEHLIPDEEERGHALKRIAFDIQKPDAKCNWHLVMIGVYGAGKDSLMMPIAKIFGDAFSVVGNDEIKSPYDDGFAKRKIIHVNEVRGLSGNALEKVKRRAATQGGAWETLNIKSEKQILHPNLWSFYFLTNHKDAMNIDKDERRFFVTYASSQMDEDLQGRYFRWLEGDDGPAKLFNFLLNVDLSEFDPSRVPMKTKAFLEMVEDSKSDAQMDLDQIMVDGTFGFNEGLIDVKLVADSIRSKGSFCRPSDVKVFLDKQKWKQVESIYTAAAKNKGKTVRLPTTLWAPADSELHELSGADLYHAVRKIQQASDFLDD